MCDWGGGPNELSNYLYPERTRMKPAKEVTNLPRNQRANEDLYKYIGRAETSLMDTGTMMWMCLEDGTVTSDWALHEQAAHASRA